VSNEPDSADKLVDLVGRYMDPSDNALVLCVDEKTQVLVLDRASGGLPLEYRLRRKRTHNKKSHGKTAFYPVSTPTEK